VEGGGDRDVHSPADKVQIVRVLKWECGLTYHVLVPGETERGSGDRGDLGSTSELRRPSKTRAMIQRKTVRLPTRKAGIETKVVLCNSKEKRGRLTRERGRGGKKSRPEK